MGCINWAWKIQGLKSNEKVMLLAVSDRADKETGVCISPIPRLARDCGGWSRQQANRVLKRIGDYGLVRATLRYPGTDDTSRMFTCNLAIDPETWRPPKGKGRNVQEAYYVNLVELDAKLHGALIRSFPTPSGIAIYENYITSMHVIECRKGRLLCRVPDAETARKIWDHQKVIIECAQKFNSSIKTLRFLWDRKPPKK